MDAETISDNFYAIVKTSDIGTLYAMRRLLDELYKFRCSRMTLYWDMYQHVYDLVDAEEKLREAEEYDYEVNMRGEG